MQTLPFLYLPDAVTMILLLLVLSMLRSVAVSHIRQELLIIRKEMLSFWLNNGLEWTDTGYNALRRLIDASIRLSPKLSPARLLFNYRLQRRMAKRGTPLPIPDPAREVCRSIEETADRNGRAKLKRLQMEMNLSLGTYFLMASLSGWVLLFTIVPGMIKRSFANHSDHRADVFFDMAERVLGRLGRRAQRIGFTTEAWTGARGSGAATLVPPVEC